MRSPRPIHMDSGENGEVSFCTLGKQWHFHSRAVPLLSFLERQRRCSFAELKVAAPVTIDERTLKTFLAELFHEGLVLLQ